MSSRLQSESSKYQTKEAGTRGTQLEIGSGVGGLDGAGGGAGGGAAGTTGTGLGDWKNKLACPDNLEYSKWIDTYTRKTRKNQSQWPCCQ